MKNKKMLYSGHLQNDYQSTHFRMLSVWDDEAEKVHQDRLDKLSKQNGLHGGLIGIALFVLILFVALLYWNHNRIRKSKINILKVHEGPKISKE